MQTKPASPGKTAQKQTGAPVRTKIALCPEDLALAKTAGDVLNHLVAVVLTATGEYSPAAADALRGLLKNGGKIEVVARAAKLNAAPTSCSSTPCRPMTLTDAHRRLRDYLPMKRGAAAGRPVTRDAFRRAYYDADPATPYPAAWERPDPYPILRRHPHPERPDRIDPAAVDFAIWQQEQYRLGERGPCSFLVVDLVAALKAALASQLTAVRLGV